MGMVFDDCGEKFLTFLKEQANIAPEFVDAHILKKYGKLSPFHLYHAIQEFMYYNINSTIPEFINIMKDTIIIMLNIPCESPFTFKWETKVYSISIYVEKMFMISAFFAWEDTILILFCNYVGKKHAYFFLRDFSKFNLYINH